MDGRIAIGGRGAPYRLGRPIDERNERDDAVRSRLENALRTHFPAAAGARITHHWGGPLAAPRDWSMSVNFNRESGLGWAGGYTGHGVAASNISGRTLADLVVGRDSELVSLPWVGHRARNWEPEPLRYLASTAIVRILGSADRLEDRSGRRARRTALVAPFLPPR
jgi:glycine/D-amino acid oxidase-like deaminating enzyme